MQNYMLERRGAAEAIELRKSRHCSGGCFCCIEDCMKICYDKIGRLGFRGCE